METLLTFDNLMTLVTLTGLEIVLGIDNIVFISILSSKLKTAAEQNRARTVGLMLAMGMRILLLLAITWVMGLTKELFAVWGHSFSGRDLILLVGGLFLIAKATFEVHAKLEGEHHAEQGAAPASMGALLFQIMLLDIVFSLDSVITAVGMSNEIVVMIAAVMIAVGVMMIAARAVSEFIERHPTMKMLALSFLMLIGVMLTAEGFGHHIEKGYIYFAMAFSLAVECLNIRVRKQAHPVKLSSPSLPKLEA